MDAEAISLAMAMVRQILEFQKDGYADFILKNGKEKNPQPKDPNDPLEECIVLDMTLSKEALAAQRAEEKKFIKDQKDGKIPSQAEFSGHPETKTVNFFHG